MLYIDPSEIEAPLSRLAFLSDVLELALLAPSDELTPKGHASLALFALDIAALAHSALETCQTARVRPVIELELCNPDNSAIPKTVPGESASEREVRFRRLQKIMPEAVRAV